EIGCVPQGKCRACAPTSSVRSQGSDARDEPQRGACRTRVNPWGIALTRKSRSGSERGATLTRGERAELHPGVLTEGRWTLRMYGTRTLAVRGGTAITTPFTQRVNVMTDTRSPLP